MWIFASYSQGWRFLAFVITLDVACWCWWRVCVVVVIVLQPYVSVVLTLVVCYCCRWIGVGGNGWRCGESSSGVGLSNTEVQGKPQLPNRCTMHCLGSCLAVYWSNEWNRREVVLHVPIDTYSAGTAKIYFAISSAMDIIGTAHATSGLHPRIRIHLHW